MFLSDCLFLPSHSHKCTHHIIPTNSNIDICRYLFFIFISIFIHFAQACIYTARTFSSERVKARKAVWLLAVFRLAKRNTGGKKPSKVLYKPFFSSSSGPFSCRYFQSLLFLGPEWNLSAKFRNFISVSGGNGGFIVKEMQCSLPCLKRKRNNIK